jgi:hypothetical protein
MPTGGEVSRRLVSGEADDLRVIVRQGIRAADVDSKVLRATGFGVSRSPGVGPRTNPLAGTAAVTPE